MSSTNDYKVEDQIYDGISEYYVEVDVPKKKNEGACHNQVQEVQRVSGLAIEEPSYYGSYKRIKPHFKNYAMFVFMATSTVMLVCACAIMVVLYIKIEASGCSGNESQQFLKESFMNTLLEPFIMSSNSSNSRLLYEFKELLVSFGDKRINENSVSNSTSCADVLHHNPSSPSGYYLVRSSTGQLVSVYCDMTRTCGNITGGWMRVAQLDVDYCYRGLKSKVFEGIETCVVNNDSAGCTQVSFSSFNIRYSKICGKVRGYGVGSVDGLYKGSSFRGNKVDDNYLDGVSVTSGGNHVWSFVAGHCYRCSNTPVFVGADWTCSESKCKDGEFCDSFLWRTRTCGQEGIFLKTLVSSTTADITIGVCRDEDRENEDIALTEIDFYVY